MRPRNQEKSDKSHTCKKTVSKQKLSQNLKIEMFRAADLSYMDFGKTKPPTKQSLVGKAAGLGPLMRGKRPFLTWTS